MNYEIGDTVMILSSKVIFTIGGYSQQGEYNNDVIYDSICGNLHVDGSNLELVQSRRRKATLKVTEEPDLNVKSPLCELIHDYYKDFYPSLKLVAWREDQQGISVSYRTINGDLKSHIITDYDLMGYIYKKTKD